jgi:hypothetical protein
MTASREEESLFWRDFFHDHFHNSGDLCGDLGRELLAWSLCIPGDDADENGLRAVSRELKLVEGLQEMVFGGIHRSPRQVDDLFRSDPVHRSRFIGCLQDIDNDDLFPPIDEIGCFGDGLSDLQALHVFGKPTASSALATWDPNPASRP